MFLLKFSIIIDCLFYLVKQQPHELTPCLEKNSGSWRTSCFRCFIVLKSTGGAGSSALQVLTKHADSDGPTPCICITAATLPVYAPSDFMAKLSNEYDTSE